MRQGGVSCYGISRHTAAIPSSDPAIFATSYNNILYTRSYTLGSELVAPYM